jgi:hypothetical protein
MSVINERTAALLAVQLRAVHVATGHAGLGLPVSSSVTALMKHGGIYTLTDNEMMTARLTALGAGSHAQPGASSSTAPPPMDVPFIALAAGSMAGDFFYHLLSDPLGIPQDLMSYLTFPEDGKTHTPLGQFVSSPTSLPAAFTFVGQFIDHDLTMNAVNLFDMQTGAITDGASPLIDLDSVYGPRSGKPQAPIVQGDHFALVKIANNVFDYERDPNTATALIPDGRNDENQIVAQLQILLMRLHNKFADTMSFDEARRQTLFNWQSVVLNDYLPKVCDNTVLASVRAALDAKDYSKLKHHPLIDPATGRLIVSMPHEFAIAFRFGHSQLRDAYTLNPANPPIRLFDNRNPDANDLRGARVLPAAHGIDWPFFLSAGTDATKISNRIDSQIADVVFDLPASAIPDQIPFVSNLALRNLIRSNQIGLGSGEALADFYDPANKLSAAEIEPNASARKFFKDSNADSAAPPFRTPLWYYILKEAEQGAAGRFGSGAVGFLGPVGSRLVAEVVAGGVYYNPPDQNLILNPSWKSTIASGADKRSVSLSDIVAAVTV